MIKKKNKCFKRFIRNLIVKLIISEIGVVYTVLKDDGFAYLIDKFTRGNLNLVEYMLSGLYILSLYDYLTYRRNMR